MYIDKFYYDSSRSKGAPLKKVSHDTEIDRAGRSVLLMSYLYVFLKTETKTTAWGSQAKQQIISMATKVFQIVANLVTWFFRVLKATFETMGRKTRIAACLTLVLIVFIFFTFRKIPMHR